MMKNEDDTVGCELLIVLHNKIISLASHHTTAQSSERSAQRDSLGGCGGGDIS